MGLNPRGLPRNNYLVTRSKDSKEIHKSHIVTVLLYHVVCAIKYRRIVIDEKVDKVIKEVSMELEFRYDLYFLEVGTNLDHIHFLIQSVPDYSVTKIVRTVKSIIAREVYRQCAEVKEQLWGGGFLVKVIIQIQLGNTVPRI
jgi:REP element-mobilizing transposase RayT